MTTKSLFCNYIYNFTSNWVGTERLFTSKVDSSKNSHKNKINVVDIFFNIHYISSK